MIANKMPEANVRFVALTHDIQFADGVEVTGETLDLYTADQMRAMYLAGIEAAKACVPERRNDVLGLAAVEWNACRAATLTNLKALEEGVAKGPALEQEAKK